MRKIVSLLAASSLIVGSTSPSLARTTRHHARFAAPAAPATTTTCSSPTPFIWNKLGGDPYARTRAEAMQKAPQAFADAVAAGCMPQGAVEGGLKFIRDNPDGNVRGVTRVIITKGMHFPFMESKSHPYFNVIVGDVKVSKGVSSGVEATSWTFAYDGWLYFWYLPDICGNWMLQKQRIPSAPPPPDDRCYVINVQFRNQVDHPDQKDQSSHNGFYGPGVFDGPCWGYRFAGEQEWHDNRACPDDTCNYDSITKEVGGMHLAFKGKVDLTKAPAGVNWVQYRVSSQFAHSATNMGLFCLKNAKGLMSCGNMVINTDYHGVEASMFRSLEEYPKDRPGHRIIFDWFVDPLDCLKYYTH